jgi:DNA polymerase I
MQITPMSDNCGASLIDWFDAIWHVDFEFRQDANHHPVPVCMYAFEQRTGTEIELWRDQLLACKRAPFDTGPRSLMVAYAANAELSCFLALGWEFPCNVLDAYVENVAVINGRTDIWPSKGRPNLLAALELWDLPSRSKAYKDEMRDLILSTPDPTAEQRQAIQNYNRDDVVDTVALLGALAPTIDLPRALFRGRYIAAVARMEWVGLPIDCFILNALLADWERIQLHYIARDDEFGLYEGTSFREQRLEDLVARMGWDWPRTEHGRLERKAKTIGKQAKRYPQLKKLAHLQQTIAELRIGQLANTVGADGFSRCPIMPFWTKTGRNQPQGKDKIFLPALPGWLHGLIKPPPGWGVAELDWEGQEIAAMAGQSGDQAMIKDYKSGDPHLEGRHCGDWRLAHQCID